MGYDDDSQPTTFNQLRRGSGFLGQTGGDGMGILFRGKGQRFRVKASGSRDVLFRESLKSMGPVLERCLQGQMSSNIGDP